MSRWQSYPIYKDSGVEWLGGIPRHWDIKRLRFLCETNPSKSESSDLPPDMEVSFLPMDKIGSDGTFALDETRTIEQVRQGYTYFRDNDVVVAKITPCFENGKGAVLEGLVNGIGFGTTELHVLRATHVVDSKFIFYLTRSYPFRRLGVASMYGTAGQQRVPEDYVRDFATPLPSLPEQRAIAPFLDRETAKIDAAVAEQRRLIDFLQERRAALIQRAVTRGLDPHVPRQDSGVEWLGEVPAHWRIVRSKRTFTPRTELARANDVQLSATQAYGVIPQNEFERRVGRRIVKIVRHLEKRRHVEIDDFVISMRSFQGGLERAWAAGCIRSSYVVLRAATPVCVSYFQYLFKSGCYIGALQSTANFIRDGQDLNYSNFCAVDLPFPSLEEQGAIAAFLDRETAKLDAAVSEAERAIAYLEEYRTALIAAAVTGQIDVRGEVVPGIAEHQLGLVFP